MTAAQRFLVFVHAALVVAFAGYTLALAVRFVEQAQTGYISEGAQAGPLVGVVTLACALVPAGGVWLWVRTGHRRFALVADGVAIAASWTVLLVLIFFEPIIYVAVLGLTLLCPLVAAVVHGPATRNSGSHRGGIP